MAVAFRVDASMEIGTGHVMRCLALADALQAHGAKCRFVCRPGRGHLIDLLRERGYFVHSLPLDGPAGQPAAPYAHSPWLGTDQQTDARQTLAVLDPAPVDLLVVDHYAIGAPWEQAMRKAAGRIMAIDDLADRPHDTDLLLDQNPGRHAADYTGLAPAHCEVLAGPQHALLRPEFPAHRPATLAARASRGGLRRLLVAMGGVDRDNATGEVLEALRTCPVPPGGHVTVLMGANAPWLGAVREQASVAPWPTEVLAGMTRIAPLLAEADLAIGAAGTSALERCCLGLPSLLMVLADNQRAAANALERAGASHLIERGAGLGPTLASLLERLREPGRLHALSLASAAITSGEGAMKLAEVLTRDTR